tara:strand:+ start:1523 stop:1789 length:267 start_codon:yes stop_codon:yes gene_type:complete
MIDRIKEKFFGPKATLEFNLGNYEEETAFKRAVKSTDMVSALYDISRIPREYEKSNIGLDVDATDDFYSERIFKILNEYSIDLEDLME